MARMPQIPEPNIGERPGGGRVERAELIDPALGGARAIAEGAEVVGEIAGQRAQFEAQQRAADEKLQGMADEVTATRMAGDHAEKLRGILDQIQQENKDTPELIPEKFRRASQEQTDAEIGAQTSQQVAMFASRKYAAIDDQQLAAAHSFSRLRIVQKAKDNFVKLGDGSVKEAQSASTLAGLEVAGRKVEQQLGPLAKNLHEDGDAAVKGILKRQAMGWLDANSERSPATVRAALDQKDSFLTKNLSAEELMAARKRNQTDFKNYGENQKWQTIMESAYRGNRAWGLFASGDLNASNLTSLREEYDAHDRSIEANANLDDVQKDRLHDVVEQDRKAADYLYNATRKPGRFDPQPDPQIEARLHDDVTALTKAKNNSPKDLETFVETRNNILKAVADHQITQSRGETLMGSMSQMLVKAENREAKNTGWRLPFTSISVWSSPQQKGNVQINDAFSGKYKHFTIEQKNHARYAFMQAMVEAKAKNSDANFDDATIRHMVQQSLEYARSGGKE